MYAQKLENSPSVKRRLDVLVRPQIEVFKNNRNCTYACDACETKNKSVVHVLVTTGRTYGMSRYLCDECRKKCGLSEVAVGETIAISKDHPSVEKVYRIVESNDQVEPDKTGGTNK